MNLDTLKSLGGLKFQKALFKIRQFAPEILTAIGVLGTVTSTVLIAKATLRLEPVLERFENSIADTKARFVDSTGDPQYKRELAKIYVQFVLDLTKLYGPGVSLGLASIASILGAHGIMRRRQVAILAAYKTVETAFMEYRNRVAAEFGADKDLDLASGYVTMKQKDEETGKTKSVKALNPNEMSPYSRWFDEGNENWSDNPGINQFFVKAHQTYMNQRLQAVGHLFLNEVYDVLGMPRTNEGAAVGWLIGDTGDNYVDFGLLNPRNEMAREFINGYEKNILLDFNVDGVIIGKL